MPYASPPVPITPKVRANKRALRKPRMRDTNVPEARSALARPMLDVIGEGSPTEALGTPGSGSASGPGWLVICRLSSTHDAANKANTEDHNDERSEGENDGCLPASLNIDFG